VFYVEHFPIHRASPQTG